MAPPSTAYTQATAVIVAAFNAEATIERALISALDQPETTEICVVEDVSHDCTAAIVEKVAAQDSRVRLLRQSVNAGPAAARNRAIAATAAPWLAVLDADDYFAPGRLGRLHDLASDADFVADRLIRCKAGETPAWSPKKLTPQPLTLVDFVLGNTGRAGGQLHLGFLKPLMRRAFLDEHGLRYQPMRLGEDYELYARALLSGARFLVCGEAGYISIERPGSLSRAHTEEDLKLLRDCDDDLQRVRPLSAPERRALRRHRSSVDCRYQWRRLISAVKAKNLPAALSTVTSPAVAGYLLGKLTQEAWRRSTGRSPQISRRGASRLIENGLNRRRGW